MSSTDSFGPNTTLVKYPWPQGISGLERVLLSANGGLQRLLAAYFAQQIEAEVVSTHTSYSSSPDGDDKEDGKTLPLTQRRVINLLCNGTVVVTATSTIVVHSREIANLFDKGYFIGQVIRTLQQTPSFNLLDVQVQEIVEPAPFADLDAADSDSGGSGTSTPSRIRQRLWRQYKLCVEGLECNIEELFLDREMFH
ncbi:hypothetical protein AURDEDRAFT_115164 [Auricularia subglabra TFB-10046 SS5]|nr:hypothetical protein AURDEDRAFT_115164 [Auricularia subglabra TFB-10046 SS5]